MRHLLASSFNDGIRWPRGGDKALPSGDKLCFSDLVLLSVVPDDQLRKVQQVVFRLRSRQKAK